MTARPTRRVLAVALVALAACHRSTPARTAPSPTTEASATAAAREGGHAGAAGSPDENSGVSPTDVAAEAVRIFGDSTADSSEPEGGGDVSPEPTWDIDVRSYETHKRVEYYLQRFQGPVRATFSEWLSRGTRYEPMIRAKLQAAGLPGDLTYLALIESGYNPHAYSRAAAVGMWQMMTATAKGVGLRVDWWIDERRDPVRSTDAAIRFLNYLHEQFGSLYLAAAAYNGGPGRVARGLSRYADQLEGSTGEDVFFALAEQNYLRAETRDYVPKMIAAALVAKDPQRYGIAIESRPVLEYDTVRVGPETPIAAIANAAGVTLEDVRELNPQVLRGVTPLKDSLTIRVPVGKAEGFDSAYAALPEEDRKAFTRVTTKKGATMVSTARRGGITTKQLKWYNPKLKATKSGALPVGRVVLLPSRAVVAAAYDIPDPAIERYGSSRGRTHIVRKGESLGLIAKRYKTSVKTLMRLNGLRKSVIYPGQVIVVRGRR
ncbi:MAG TPA: transglycosylase SLT domain-containing protein [Gemmatimonadaceae bacterium]|nr:transglycosylase SLT domain-containing protein [Gemmatimonadaceae bacterium]